MKPLNYDNSPCSPTSSNCVIWQGPDLDCIKLCKGDTISDVTASLATELCTVMDQLSITNYDLSCFELVGCKPETFQELLQFLIKQICLLENTSTTTSIENDVLQLKSLVTNDSLISVASCFVVDGITRMSLNDYVRLIGLRICLLVEQIATIENTLFNLNIRVSNLEGVLPTTYTLPSITVSCTLQNSPLVGSGTPALQIDQILNILINDSTYGYCALRSATGLPTNLISSILTQCIINSDIQLSTGTAYSANVNWNSNWNTTDVTIAASLKNIWVVLCDVYTYLQSIINIQDTNTINLSLSPTNVLSAEVQDSDWHDLIGFDWYGVNIISQRPQARRIGNVIYFRGIVMVPIGSSSSDQPIIWDYSFPGVDTYVLQTLTKPSETGTGSVYIDTDSSIIFNQNFPVIPINVLPTAINLDTTYTYNWEIAARNILLVQSPSVTNPTGVLNTLFKIIITSDKKLKIQLFKNIEESPTNTQSDIFGTAIGNNLISNVHVNDYVPFYRDPLSVMNSSPLSGVQNVELMYGTDSGYTYQYPFSCEASDVNQVGGFGGIQLDGYSVYISPCATSIPTPTPCAIP